MHKRNLNQKSCIKSLAALSVHCNVSLDGFSSKSHGKFRGDKNSFIKTVEAIEALAQYNLLQGLLVTPNNLADISEYSKLCEFAIKNKATYVLMNPLSSMGRGVKSSNKLAASTTMMQQIADSTQSFEDKISMVRIRFPNERKLPLAGCEAGNIIYVFTHGELAVCPYLVFAARTPKSKHRAEEFIVGNIFHDRDIAEHLDAYKLHDRYGLGGNQTCANCRLNTDCGKGCPAAIISASKRIEEVDTKMCPLANQ